MEDNVALDSAKQKKFNKSIRSIKKILKKNDGKPLINRTANKRIDKKERRPKGLVYLSHIPHGFYEHEMTQYFSQFGGVTNARVIRSKNTGRSKGYAFVEFREPAVAEIVAETMNNYLMGKRLIKAVCIPPEKQRRAMRMHWSPANNPANDLRLKLKKAYNADKDDAEHLKRAKKILSNLNNTKKRLKELGIDYDFFTPVDFPEALKSNVKTEIRKEDQKVFVKKEKQEKKPEIEIAKEKPIKKKEGKSIQMNGKESQETKMKKKGIEKIQDDVKKNKTKLDGKSYANKFDEPINVKQNNLKKNKDGENQHNIKKLNIKPLEDFIKTENDESGSNDSSIEFDSDEYEKLIEEDEDSNESRESDEENDQDDSAVDQENGSADEDSESEAEEVPALKNTLKLLKKNKKGPLAPPPSLGKNNAKTKDLKRKQPAQLQAPKNVDGKKKKNIKQKSKHNNIIEKIVNKNKDKKQFKRKNK